MTSLSSGASNDAPGQRLQILLKRAADNSEPVLVIYSAQQDSFQGSLVRAIAAIFNASAMVG